MSKPQSILTPEQIEGIRDDLLRQLGKLERSMKSNGATRPADLDQSCIGRLSRIEALQNQRFVQDLQEREKILFSQVLDALRRIEEGGYGLCSACHEPIRYERLQIFPETPSCAPCGTGG